MADFDPTKAPRELRLAIMKALRECRQIVQSSAISHLGRVLKQRTGVLASSVNARVRQTPYGGYLQVGTPRYYGRFWEYGFQRRGKSYRRPWLQPAVEATQAEVARRIQTHVATAVNDQFKSITIDINIKL